VRIVKKNSLVCPALKHGAKAGLISSVLLCHCVWVGHGFEDFLDLCENVFLIRYHGVFNSPQVEFFFH
jgi:hypothetical protein